MEASEVQISADGALSPLVVVGASAGGVEALAMLVASLSPGFGAPVLIVLHVAPAATSVLPQILNRAGRLPAHAAVDGEELIGGQIYVAPADHHMLVDDGRLRLTSGPRENGHRPAIDPTMRTAAFYYGAGVVGVVLSGSRDDGTAGLVAIKAAGGRAVVQDPEEALFASMPRSAIENVEADAVLHAGDMGAWLDAATEAEADMEETPTMSSGTDPEPPPVSDDAVGTRFTCPDCGGVLFEEREGPLTRYRCSVGHAFSPESLLEEHGQAVEEAVWMAVRSLEDRAELLERLAQRVHGRGGRRSATSFREQAADVRAQAQTIRAAVGFPVADIDTAA